MLTRSDVERITENMLMELSLEVKRGDFTNPNSRTVVLKYKDREISHAYFDVCQENEYPG